MSDNLKDKKYKTIDPDSIVELKINGKFYDDMRAALSYFLNKNNTKEEVNKKLGNIIANTLQSDDEHALHILYSFCMYMQNAAIDQGYTVMKPSEQVTKEFLESQDSESDPSE